jgi:mannitol/fructose-specific phosphotransferase system IIA component (Ntr-type)
MFLSQQLHLIVPEEEVGFITLHLGGIIESRKRHQILRVALVCNAGMATVRILEARLKAEFQDIVIEQYLSYADYLDKKHFSVDIVVSTIELHHPTLPVIVVNPLLEEMDVNHLKEYFHQKLPSDESKQERTQELTATQIIEEVEKYSTIHSRNALERALKTLLNDPKKESIPRLSSLLHKDLVFLQSEAEDWVNAVKIGTQALIKKKAITENYELMLLENIRRLKAYVVIKSGVAIPHAKPEDGVNYLALSFVLLKKGVYFGHPKNDPVNFILILASPNTTSHLKALESFIRIIKNDENLQALSKIQDFETFKKTIKNLEGE